MTEQYLQKTINREGFRYVDQSEIDPVLLAVPLGPDDKFVFCGDDGVTGPYRVDMPNVADCAGVQFTLKMDPGGVAVTVQSAAGDTFDGGGPIVTAAGNSVVLNGDPPTPPVPPAIVSTPPTNWSIIKVGAP